MLPNQIELAQPVVQLGFGQDFYVGSVTQFLDFCGANIFALIYYACFRKETKNAMSYLLEQRIERNASQVVSSLKSLE